MTGQKQPYEAPEAQVVVIKDEGVICASPGLGNYNKGDYYEE